MKVYVITKTTGSYEDTWTSVAGVHATKLGAINRVEQYRIERLEAEKEVSKCMNCPCENVGIFELFENDEERIQVVKEYCDKFVDDGGEELGCKNCKDADLFCDEKPSYDIAEFEVKE